MNRMKHPQHGFHHPQSIAELETMRANGWTDDVPEAVEAAPEAAEPQEERTKRPYNRKPK